MKIIASVLRFLCAGLVMVAAPWAVAQYEEDFDDGKADDWEVISGDWKIEDGEYTQFEEQAPGGGEARNRAVAYAIGNTAWTDYTFEVRIKPISTTNYAGVMFRVVEIDPGPDGNTFNANSEYYYWLIGIGGDYSKLWHPIASAVEETPGDTLIAGEWNDVKVEMYGQNVKLYLNGEEQKDFDFPNNAQVEFGGIALATYNASAIFDDVRVSGTGIIAVAPGGKLAVTWGNLKSGRLTGCEG